MIITFLGLPGTGKGTYAEMLIKRRGFEHISAGEVIRQLAAANVPEAVEAKKLVDKGQYAPDELMVPIFAKKVEELQRECKDILFDNFPGNISQAEACKGRIKIDHYFYFYAPRKILIDRISGRITCKKCGAIFHKTNIIPKKEGVCDFCGGELYQRDDQKPAVVEQRLQTYENQQTPFVEYLEKQGNLVKIDASPPIEKAETVIHKIELALGKIKEIKHNNELR